MALRSNLAQLAAALVAVALLAVRPACAAIELQVWHSLDGANGLVISKMADDFNASQGNYKVITIYKGPYAETLSGGIAAYRAGAAPHILQVFEVGNGTMAAAVGAVKPVSDVFAYSNSPVTPDDLLPVLATNYLSRSGKLLSLPYNISSMIMWINRDRFRKAGLDPEQLPRTWPEVFEAARAIRKADPTSCALSTAWPVWANIEQLSAWHDRPVASRANGLAGFDTELEFNRPVQVRHLENLVTLSREGVFQYLGRTNLGEAKFLSGDCAIFVTSSAMYGAIRGKNTFDWTVLPMPYYPDVPEAPQNAILGGGSLYVMQGKSDLEYRGVSEFLTFILGPEEQAIMYRNSGYLPITRAAYEEALRSGAYGENPPLRTAIESVTRKRPTPNSSGLRLGNMLQIRDIWAEEIEAALNGAKTAQQALDDAVARGNEVLRLFRQRTAN
ncbi:sn-glycerol-3-phosphate ABC transporter substrate-binding protein UgpB [Methylobacterium trifolii]|uniref:sn-glycerol-3-phosphate-binding periplasmic protein UgpB n=1 Tax=Methylobacterium trifolii TaxID=1003092 RepID=A0ABQ4U1P3_9HYPH|nr:sn-glycerol-3-phosphate ABC transporter substrate-binding protein UgpB [Methylobacterium trifolii]GJE60233.1 sn-glycerol-3-phosphate-binding periplasmic protein UgpB [Methylobacterium trifolii]